MTDPNIDRLREWIDKGIAESLENDPSGFMLGVESVSALELCDALAAELDAAKRERDDWEATARVESDGLMQWRARAERAEAALDAARKALRELVNANAAVMPGDFRTHDGLHRAIRRSRAALAADAADGPFAECICPVEGCLVHPAAEEE